MKRERDQMGEGEAEMGRSLGDRFEQQAGHRETKCVV